VYEEMWIFFKNIDYNGLEQSRHANSYHLAMNISCDECRQSPLRSYYSCYDCENYDYCDFCHMIRSQLSHDKSHRFIRIVPSVLNGGSIGHDHGIQSKMGYTLEFHSNGNLCIYKRDNGRPQGYIWESGTEGSPSEVLSNRQGTIQLLMGDNIVWERSAGQDRVLMDFEDDVLMVSYDRKIFWRSDLAIQEDLMSEIFNHLGFRLIYIDDNGKSLVETHGNIPLQHKIMEHGYRCISHVWGDTEGQEWSHDISGVGHKVFVREEKRDKLMYLFDHYKGYWWMDVFCTNQEDIDKPLDVMDKIYANCTECICLIDGKSTYIDQSDINVDGIYNKGFSGIPRRDHESYDDVKEDFCAIFPLFSNCRWITRLWILQEAMLPPITFYTEETLHQRRQHMITMETMSNIRYRNKGHLRYYENGAFIELMKAKTNRIYNSEQIYKLAIESKRSCKEPGDYAYSLCGVFKTSIDKDLLPDAAILGLLKTLPDREIFVVTKSELHLFNNGPENIYPIAESSWESAKEVFSQWKFQKQMYTFGCNRSNSYSRVGFDIGNLESKRSLGEYAERYRENSEVHEGVGVSREDAVALSDATILRIMHSVSPSMWQKGVTYWNDKHLYVAKHRVIITSRELDINIGDRIVLGQQRGFHRDAYLCDITEDKIVKPFGRVIRLWGEDGYDT
jgi:hypothetical protein